MRVALAKGLSTNKIKYDADDLADLSARGPRSFPSPLLHPLVLGRRRHVVSTGCVVVRDECHCRSGRAWPRRRMELGSRVAKLLGKLSGQWWMQVNSVSVPSRSIIWWSTPADSRAGICDSSQDDDYLTNAVDCMVRSCDADGPNVALNFLAPLQMYCKATRDEIADSVMKSAYACATAPAATTSATRSSTRKVEHPTTTSSGADHELESTITSTVTLTSTNDDGNTVQVLIPIEMGPSTMITGEIVTRTLDSEATATSYAEAASTPTAAAPSQTQDSPSSTSTARESNIGNGSPFDLSAGGGGSHLGFSMAACGVGILLGLWTCV